MFEIALVFQVVIWVLVVSLFFASNQASIFHPSTVYLFFHGLVFVYRPLMVCFFGFDSVWNYITIKPDESYWVQTLEATSLGMVVFVSISLLISSRNPNFKNGKSVRSSRTDHYALMATTALLFPLIAYSVYFTVTDQAKGTNTPNGVYININSTGYLNEAQFMVAPLICAWLVITRFNKKVIIPIVMYMGYRTWCGWARFTIVTFCITFILCYCWQKRKKWIPAWAVISAIPLLLLFNTLGHNRDYLKNYLAGKTVAALEYSAGSTAMEKFRVAFDSPDFANFDYLAYVMSVVPERTKTFTYGVQHLQIFTEPIPRILWREKPVGAPISFFNLMEYGNFNGLTVSMVGDGWITGGWIGIVITMGLAAVIAGWFHRWFWTYNYNPIVALFYTSATAMLMQWYRDGGYVSMAKFLFWSWLPLLMWVAIEWLISSKRISIYSTILMSDSRIRILQPEK